MYKYIAIAAAIFAVGFGTAWLLRTNTIDGMKTTYANQKTEAAQQYSKQLKTANDYSETLKVQINDLNVSSTNQLQAQLVENERLRTSLNAANATKRMFLKGTTCPKQSTSSTSNTTTRQSNDDGSIELSPATRQLVSDLRASLITDTAKVNYLQAYIKNLLSLIDKYNKAQNNSPQ